MPYQPNFAGNQWPEFQGGPNADSFNGRVGSRAPGAVSNQRTQTVPQSTTDAYQAFKNAASTWSSIGQQQEPSSFTPPAAAPGMMSQAGQLASVVTRPGSIATNVFQNPDNGNPDTQYGPGSHVPYSPPPPPPPPETRRRPGGGGLPSGPGPWQYDPVTKKWIAAPVQTPDSPHPPGYVWDPNLHTWIPSDFDPNNPNNIVKPPPPPNTGTGGPPPGAQPKITPTPPTYPDLGQILAQMRALNQPEFTMEQNDLARQQAAAGAQSGSIYGGGYQESAQRGMADLIAKQGQSLTGPLNAAEQNNLNRQLQQYGIDINDRQFWANLSLRAFQGDQQAQQFYTWLMTTLGLTPAQIAAIVGGTTPGIAFQP